MKAKWNKNEDLLILTAENDEERRIFKEMGSQGGSVVFRECGHKPNEFRMRREETFIPDDNT